MRPPPQIKLVFSEAIGATYDGRERTILLSTTAAEKLTAKELACVIEHEKGHHYLWHIERATACLCATLVTTAYYLGLGELGLAIVAFLLGYGVHRLSRVMAEFEADYRAIRINGAGYLLGVFRKQEQYHPDMKTAWMFRARRGVARWLKERGQ